MVEVRETEGLNATPIWFGPTDRPLFGWLHLPEEARAGVVLCRPIGLEELSVHPRLPVPCGATGSDRCGDAPIRLYGYRRLGRGPRRPGRHRNMAVGHRNSDRLCAADGRFSRSADRHSTRRDPRRERCRRQRRRGARALGPMRNRSWVLTRTALARGRDRHRGPNRAGLGGRTRDPWSAVAGRPR